MSALRCSTCGVKLPKGRVLRKCQPCQREQVKAWRDAIGPMRATTEFPGVDIDALHRKLGATRR